MINFLVYLASGILVFLLLLASVTFIIKEVVTPYKIITMPITFENMISSLQIIINTEIDTYEKNIFKKQGTLTSQNYENFYNDITRNIITSLPDEYYLRMGIYMKKGAVVTYICKTVNTYLTEKVNGTL